MENTNQFTVSSYTGTGSAITVTTGFKPELVLIANETDGDVIMFHINGMADASYGKLIAAPTKVTTNGITLTSTGFTVGTDAVLNEAGKVCKYIALGNISNQVYAGTYTGTGAAQSITPGFKPLFVLAYNYTDGDAIWGHIQGMTAATAFKLTTLTAAVAANGCTITQQGFDLGSDAVINENTKVYYYIAVGDISNQFKIGTHTGTATAKSITTGFKPLMFLSYNQTDGDEFVYYVQGMTAATGFKFDTDALAITNGITVGDRTVTIGTDDSVNETDKVFVYAAI